MTAKILFPMVLILPALFAWADDSNDTTPKAEPVVVTVSAQAVPLSAAPASVTVLTRDFIEQSHAENVVELLRQVPFLHISQTSGFSGLAAVTLRGGDPNFTMVMIDGIPVNDPTNLLGGSYDFSSLSTDNIEQIEIVRGPLSSLYGSEAIGGVINIVSRRGKGSSLVTGEVSAGNFASREFRGSAQGELSEFHYSLGASYFDLGELVEKESFSLGTIALTSGIDFAKQKILNFTARFHDNDTAGFPENGGGPEFSILRDTKNVESREVILGAHYLQQWKEWWLYGVDVDFFDRDEDSFTPAILDAVPPTRKSLPSLDTQTEFQRKRIQLMNNWKTGNFSSTFSLGWKEENGNSDTIIAESFPSHFSLDRTTTSFGGELLYGSKGLNASLGARFDQTDPFPLEFSPRFGLSYLFVTATRVKASWGEGYKLPSFFALGDPNVGNPELRPERSRGFDFGVEHPIYNASITLSLTYYHNSFRDLIDFSEEEFRLVNRSLVTTQGIELESRAAIMPELAINGHVAYLDANIQNSNERLRDRTRWRGGLGAEWQIRKGSHLQLNWTAVGSRFDLQLPVPDRQTVEGYDVINLAFSQNISRPCVVYARIDNLLNRHYHEFVGFPNPGLYARFGFTYRFERR